MTQESAGSDDCTNLSVYRERRLAEVQLLRDRGVNPYPYRFDRSHTLGELRAKHGVLAPGSETTDAGHHREGAR